MFSRALDSVGAFGGSALHGLPFSGEVNLLTTGAFGPGDLFSADGCRAASRISRLGSPTPGGDWTVRAAMSQGDLSSWIVAGAFASHAGAAHTLRLRRCRTARRSIRAATRRRWRRSTDGSRNVGELYASRPLDGRPAARPSTTARATRATTTSTRVRPAQPADRRHGRAGREHARRATVAQRMVAPGAEEFLSPRDTGPVAAAGADVLTAQRPAYRRSLSCRARADRSDVGIEHEFEDAYVLGVRRFYPERRRSARHAVRAEIAAAGRGPSGTTYVASAGGVDADGWAFRSEHSRPAAFEGSVDYSITRAHWQGRAVMPRPIDTVGAVQRSQTNEDLHDVTTSVETDIPETATRVFVVYKINTGYARGSTQLGARPRWPLRRSGESGAALRRCRHEVGSPGRACAICSATRTIPARSTTSCSSSGRPSASSAASCQVLSIAAFLHARRIRVFESMTPVCWKPRVSVATPKSLNDKHLCPRQRMAVRGTPFAILAPGLLRV